jgi:hypothetical protein
VTGVRRTTAGKDESLPVRETPGTARPLHGGRPRPVTGGRRVPTEKEHSGGAAGSKSQADGPAARDAFQVLIRIVYLRTQIEVWRRSMRAGGRAPHPEDLHWVLQGMETQARRGQMEAFAAACACAAGRFAPGARVSCTLLVRLDAWLDGSERYLRDPANTEGAVRLGQLARDLSEEGG